MEEVKIYDEIINSDMFKREKNIYNMEIIQYMIIL